MEPFSFRPIGVVHSPFVERVSAPRQPSPELGATGSIELYPGHDYETALEDLEGWDYVWVVFVFHMNEGWRPKVLPPRSEKKRGVFATRSPYRPNPIGISVVRLESIDGLKVRVRDLDMLDGTPVLDLKPYVPYADAHPNARTGWLEPLEGESVDSVDARAPRDPRSGYDVKWTEAAAAQAAWLRQTHDIDVATAVTRILALGPQPHPYRRIRREGDMLRLAHKEWRVRFRIDGRTVIIEAIATGYRASQLADESLALDVHRAFVARFAR